MYVLPVQKSKSLASMLLRFVVVVVCTRAISIFVAESPGSWVQLLIINELINSFIIN
jgi:hypothetical protein